MEQNEEIAMQLWDYIDGSCSEAESRRISGLIAADAEWKQLYTELSSLHTTLPAGLELEQPPMRFTKNVMDAVATVQIAPATKKYINKRIIIGIATFFIATIVCLIGYTIANTNWSTGTATISLPRINLGGIFNSSFFYAAAAINVILALVLLDVILTNSKVKIQNSKGVTPN